MELFKESDLKNIGSWLYQFALILILGCVSTGCGGGSGNSGAATQPRPPAITSVSVTCSPSSILITETSTCTAAVSGTGAYSNSVNWSVTPSTAGSVSSSGLFTPAGPGTATIAAISTQDSSKSGQSSVIAANTTAIALSIIDLPQGSAADVTFVDPAGHTIEATSSGVIGASPGNYSVTAKAVTTSASTYYAKVPTQSVQVIAGSATSVTVDYYNVIPSTTKVLDSTGLQSLKISANGATLTMNSTSAIAQALEPGDVLVVPPSDASGVAPAGLLRKVISVSAGASSIVATVTNATLADAFQRVSFQLNTQSVASSIRDVRTRPGVIFRPAESISGHKIPRAISNTSIQDPCGGSTLGIFDITDPIALSPVDGLNLSGQVELCSGIDFSVDLVGSGFLGLQPQLNSLTAEATVGEYSDLTVEGAFLNGEFNPKPVVLGTIIGDPIPIPGLPIWVTPEVSVFVGASGNVNAGISTEAAAAGSITRGVSYSGGQWTPIQPEPSIQFSLSPPVLDASLEAKAYAGVQLDLSVWDIVGPSFKPDGYLDFNADVTANPWWTLTGGVEGPMSLDVGFLGENLASYDLGNMFNYSTVIASAPGPFLPGVSTPVITSIVPSSTTAGSASFDLQITGSNFIPGAIVNFGNSSLVTSWQSSGTLTALVPASLVEASGTDQITVENPGVGVVTSNGTPFTVNPASDHVAIAPTIVDVPAGQLQTFQATIAGGAGSILWSVQEGSSGGNVTSSGIYTAPSQTGTYHVIATNASDSSESATATVSVVAGPSIKTLHSFNHTTEGAVPWGAPIFTSDGNLYGTTEAGGDLSCGYISSFAGCGTIYESDTSGNVTTVHSFDGQDGAYPAASLTVTSSEALFGTTVYGGSNTSECWAGETTTFAGCGTIFSFLPSKAFSSLFSFGPFGSPLGVGPNGGLTSATNSLLYGATSTGAKTSCTGTTDTTAATGCGSIFTFTGTGSPSELYMFGGRDGAFPTSAPIQGSDGNLYGATSAGGTLTCSSYAAPGCGTVYQMTPAGVIKTLHAFSAQDGAYPYSTLVLGSDGSFYGVTIFGGSAACSGGAKWQGCGTVFKIDSAGNFASLHSFSGPDGAYPTAIMQGSDGYFYGTTEGGGDASCAGRYGPGCGTVFRMDSAGNITILYSFTGQSDGSWPESGVVQGRDGNLYGTTAYGGTNDDGIIFRISNLTALTAGKIQGPVSDPITPVLLKQPHVGLLGPSVPAQR